MLINAKILIKSYFFKVVTDFEPLFCFGHKGVMCSFFLHKRQGNLNLSFFSITL